MKLHKLLAILITATILTLCGCGKTVDDIKNYDAILVACIYDETYGKSELYFDNSNNNIYEVRDDIIINEIANNEIYEPLELLKINEESEPYDITQTNEYCTDTWESDLNTSSAYIKYLESKGYIKTREINTQEFIDLLLSNDIETRRVIITANTISVSKVSETNFNIKNYIKK